MTQFTSDTKVTTQIEITDGPYAGEGPLPLIYRLCNWVGRLTGTVILVPHLSLVGDRTEEFFYGLIKARRERKKLFILLPYELPWRLSYNLTNIEVANVESEYRAFPTNRVPYVIGGVLITAYFAFYRTLGFMLRRLFGFELNHFYMFPRMGTFTLWQPEERMPSFSWDVVDKYEWQKQLEAPPQVWIGKRKRLIAERWRARMGLPEDAWFVCLHVREQGFRKDQGSWRSADINNYIGAIEEVTSRGGWVVRMGDTTMKKLPLMERVIDYPFTEAKNDLLDVYLVSECRAFIGTSSGLLEVPIMFQRPIILTNMPNWLWGFPLKRGDIGLLKHIYSKSKNRFLSVHEWVTEGSAGNFYRTIGDDYILYENDPKELRMVVKEFFDRGDNWQPTVLQSKFNELRVCEGRKQLSECEPIVSDVFYDNFVRYHMASRVDSAVGTLGAEFLQKNWESDERGVP